ncbi:MAG: 23S rRNA (guanine(1835)-N(2))-methyltransferase, partial [Pseudomonadota bacterium]
MTTEAVLGGHSLTLHRFPLDQKNRSLQAWDSADEYLIEHIQNEYANAQHILVLNDGFGALSCALHALDTQNSRKVTSFNDSYVSQQACLYNLEENELESRQT